MDQKDEKGLITNLVYGIPFGILTFTFDGNIILINRQAKLLLGLEQDTDKMHGKPVMDFIHNERLRRTIQRMVDNNRKSFNLQRIAVRDAYLNVRGKKLLNSNLITIIDTTENVKAIDQATQNLILGQEQERSRLAKEIHDGIGPMMSTIRFQVDALAKISSNEVVKRKLALITSMITDAAKDIRQISHDLMPSSLNDFGLVTAIENLVNNLNEKEGQGLTVYYSHKLNGRELNKDLELNLFRVVQELVNNALKHSKCSEIDIQLRNFNEKIQLTIEDNGIGADLKRSNSGMGISNIKTRVKTLHGTYDIETSPGKGFLSQIIIPINNPQ
jgi:signal transduction histidine kinase